MNFGKRDRGGFNNLDDDFGGLEMLKLEDNFSRINESSFLKDLPPQFLNNQKS